ncbi:MAG: DUF2231 domain-containing protein [Acidobacteriota bacterium]
MQQFSPSPAWDALHPFVIHFPIVLLLLSPMFIVISAILPPPRGKPYMMIAIYFLLLGTASLFIARSTGKAAARVVERGGALEVVLAAHQTFALQTVIVFSELSVMLLVVALLPRVLRRTETRLFSTALPLTFLAFYFGGVVFLMNTSQTGGRLVHEFGAHAVFSKKTGPSLQPPATAVTRIGEDRQ